MSYTSDINLKLIGIKNHKCCTFACVYGLLLFGGRLAEGIKYVSSHREKCEFLTKSFLSFSSGTPVVEEHGEAFETEILEGTDDSGLFELLSVSPHRIETKYLSSDCCKKAFMRGAFISTGFVSEPEKPYHLELKTSHHTAAEDFKQIAAEYYVHFKSLVRGGRTVLYLKSSDSVKDFLTLIGAQTFTFDYANAEFEKGLRNEINRALNCESANEDKRLDAAGKQIKAINILKEDGYVDVPLKLVELGELRLKNPELGLTELGQLLTPPLSKAGVSHRMRKIAELATERKK